MVMLFTITQLLMIIKYPVPDKIHVLLLCYCVVLDFFESDDQDSDLPQNALQLGSQQKWEVSMCCIV